MTSPLTEITVSMAEFQRNPAAVLSQAGHRPVAVLLNERPAFYMVEPTLFEALMSELAEKDLVETVKERLAQKHTAIPVNIDDL